MDDSKKAKVGWTDTEKLGVILQLVAKLGKIPWDEIELPTGRTQKACQLMLDKEKQKIKKAGQGNGEEKEDEKKKGKVAEGTTKKRKAAEKKPRASKKTKLDASVEPQSSDERDSDEQIKSEDE